MDWKKYNILLIIFVSLSALLLAASFTTRNLMKKDVVDFVKNITNIENLMMDKIMLDDSLLNQEQYNQTIILENKVRNDDAVKQISEDVTPMIIYDLLFDHTHDISFVKHDFEVVLTSYWDAFYDVISDNKKTLYTEQAFLEPLQQWNIDTYYKQQLNRIDALLQLPLKTLMFIIYILSQTWMSIVSIMTFIVSAALLYIRKTNLKQWAKNISYALYGSSVIIVFGLVLFKFIYTMLPYKLTQYIGGLHPSSFYIMGYFAFGYIFIGLLINSISQKYTS